MQERDRGLTREQRKKRGLGFVPIVERVDSHFEVARALFSRAPVY